MERMSAVAINWTALAAAVNTEATWQQRPPWRYLVALCVLWYPG